MLPGHTCVASATTRPPAREPVKNDSRSGLRGAECPRPRDDGERLRGACEGHIAPLSGRSVSVARTTIGSPVSAFHKSVSSKVRFQRGQETHSIGSRVGDLPVSETYEGRGLAEAPPVRRPYSREALDLEPARSHHAPLLDPDSQRLCNSAKAARFLGFEKLERNSARARWRRVELPVGFRGSRSAGARGSCRGSPRCARRHRSPPFR